MKDDLQVSALLDQINALEARLDPPSNKRRRFFDRLGLLALFAVSAVVDWNLLHPAVLLMLAANGPNLLTPVFQRRSVRRKLERLMGQHENLIALAKRRQLGLKDDSTVDPVGPP